MANRMFYSPVMIARIVIYEHMTNANTEMKKTFSKKDVRER